MRILTGGCDDEIEFGIVDQINYVVEDETGMHWKSMLLRLQVTEIKKKLVVYSVVRRDT